MEKLKRIIFLFSFLFLGCVSNSNINKHYEINKKSNKKEKIVFRDDKICAVGYSENKDKNKARRIAILRAKAEISRILEIHIDNMVFKKIENNKKIFTTESHQDSLNYLKDLKIVKENYKNGVYMVKICKEKK